MAYKNRFHKTTLGVDADVLVTKAVEYTDDTTMKDFVANAVEGELGIFKAADNTVITSAASVGDLVFIAMKRDGNVERTNTFPVTAGMMIKLAYVAPVKHKITVATNAATASKAIQDITYAADASGAAGNDISIEYRNTGTAGAETVSVIGKEIVVGIQSGTSTATQVKAAVDGDPDASALINATITGTAGTAQVSVAETNLTGGVDGPVPAKGDTLEVVIVETTPLMEPLPRWNYSVTVKSGETYLVALTRLAAVINDTTNIENRNKTTIVTATISGSNLVLEAKDFGVHFSVAVRGDLADNTTASVTTQFKFGSGTPDQAKLAEQAGDTKKGFTTNYPDQNALPAEFGQPTSFADANGSAAVYVTYTFEWFADDTTRTLGKEFRKNYIFLYISDGAADPISELDTVFANAD